MKPKKCLTICVGAIKGGSGKTTTAVALAQCAAEHKKKVLLIDLDQQGNASFSVNGKPDPNGALSLFHDDRPINIQHTDQHIDLLGGAPDLAAEITGKGTYYRLRDRLADLKGGYDLIIMDTAPSTTECFYNAIMAADLLIVPLQADVLNVQALLDIAAIYIQSKPYNKNLRDAGCVLTNYDGRPKIHRVFKDAIIDKGRAATIPLIGTIRQGVAIQEAQFFRRSLYDYAPGCKPAQDYMELYERILTL